MNLYRGCEHNCIYCDGRAEGYYVEGDFEKDIAVKTNAIELLQKELDPKRKRKPLKKGFILPGGGVGDSYQSIEKKYQLTRKVLHLIHDHGFSTHLLTKSILVERDLEILKQINNHNGVLVSFSLSSTNDSISKIFEPGVPLPSKRLETLSKFKNSGICSGVFLMPVIPFITDDYHVLKKSIRDIKDAGADYIIFGGMTLKEGRQKEYLYRVLESHYPEVIPKYNQIYKGDKWGNATYEYYKELNEKFFSICREYNMPIRIPYTSFSEHLDLNDLVVVLLEHMDYYLKSRGEKAPFGYAAYQISKLSASIAENKKNLQSIKGVGPVTERIIKQILNNEVPAYYKKLTSQW